MSDDITSEKPPVFNKWNGWYWLVIGITAVQFLIYFLITRSFS
jgi:hypothetical protein